MPTFQYERNAVHCVLGSVSSNWNNSMLSASWIIFFDSGLNGIKALFCRRSCWRAFRSGWFSIFWINSRKLVLCACFKTECGNPGIRKSMFTSFSIVGSWLESSWSTTGFSFLSRSVLSPTLNVSFSWQERVWQLSDTFSVFVPTTSLLVLSCAVSTLVPLLSSDERVWISLVSRTGLSVLSEERVSSRKKINIDLLKMDIFLPFCTVLVSSLTTGFPVLSRLGFRFGWFDWKLLDSCPTSGRWACSEPNSLFHSCFKEIFGGSRGDMYNFSYMTSPVSILTTFGIQ